LLVNAFHSSFQQKVFAPRAQRHHSGQSLMGPRLPILE